MLAPNDAASKLKEELVQRIPECLKLLLESKHLYQSAEVEIKQVQDDLSRSLQGQFEAQGKFAMFSVLRERWVATASEIYRSAQGSRRVVDGVIFRAPDVKVFCQRCDRIEAFNAVSFDDVLNAQPSQKMETIQVFAGSYLCQSCKWVPEVFLIRRQGIRIRLSGRAPIEHVSVPRAIDKSVAHFYSDALVAHQSGRTLAGLFYLRTLVEQWARRVTKQPGSHADDVLEAYMNGLPDDFKNRFPSLRALYSDLSADIHSATGSTDLFERARSTIVEHFDARRLFKL